MTAGILAGGRNSRYAAQTPSRAPVASKAFILIDGRPLIERTIDVLRQTTGTDILISTNTPGLFAQYDIPLIADRITESGPLGGMDALFHACTSPWLFVVACDMPFLNADLIRYIIGMAHEGQTQEGFPQAIVPQYRGRQHPLCAAYHRSAHTEIERALREGRRSMHSLLQRLDVRIIGDEEIEGIVPRWTERSFVNINTPEDHDRALRQCDDAD